MCLQVKEFSTEAEESWANRLRSLVRFGINGYALDGCKNTTTFGGGGSLGGKTAHPSAVKGVLMIVICFI